MHARILVVDDEAIVRTMLQRVLSRAGFEVQAAEDGEKAIALLSRETFDVAIVDLLMPKVDGFAVLAWLREHTPNVVAIVVSATTQIGDASKAVQQGAFDFLSKPFAESDVLVQHVWRAVEHSRLQARNDALVKELHDKNAELENRLGQLSLAHSILQSQAVAIQVDLNRAMRIQRSLLPETLPFADTVSFAAMYQPMAKVGGDLYDLFPLDDHQMGLYIADASGHGVSSAMLTVFLKHAVQGIVRGERGAVREPGEVLNALNRTLITEAFGQGVFVSMVYIILNVTTMAARYSSAGHPPLLLKRARGSVERLHRPAPVLGVNANVAYTEGDFAFLLGDMLVSFTDGVTDARSPNGEFFGEERLLKAIASSEPHADAMLDSVAGELRAFTAGCPATDDATLIVLGAEPQRSPFPKPEEKPPKAAANAARSAKVLTAQHDQRTFISLCGTGSWRESQQVLDLCDAARNAGEKSIVLDLAQCTHLDSTFLGVLHNIVTSFDRDPRCRFEIQHLPRPLLKEMSALGLTGVLVHFRHEPIPLPETMQPVEGAGPAGEELGRLLLWAHEALVEADPSNADRFAAVLEVLHNRAKAVGTESETTPSTGS